MFSSAIRYAPNIILYDLAPALIEGNERKAGRPRKYGERLGSMNECATPGHPHLHAVTELFRAFFSKKLKKADCFKKR